MYHFKIKGKTTVSRCIFAAKFPLITFEVESTQLIYLKALLLQMNLKRGGVQMFKGNEKNGQELPGEKKKKTL